MKKNINYEVINNTGIIHLNRAKALNALNLEMAESFLVQLKKWKYDSSIKRVLLTGEGKALCAGGDVKAIFLSTKESNLKKKFFQTEYTLNYAINDFKKPYLSIWNGIVMGGGVGLSIFGNKRLATEKVKFAMPETAIGFFPDVGGSYFLSRLMEGMGLYIGLTGYTLNAKESLFLGLATNYQNSNNIEFIKKNYLKDGSLPNDYEKLSGSSEIIEYRDFIKNNFHGSVISIMNRLENSNILFAKKLYKHLLKRCPMSLVITAELIKRAKNLTLKEALKMEFQVCQHMIYRNDFNE